MASEYESTSMISSDLESTSFVDSEEEDASSRITTTTGNCRDDISMISLLSIYLISQQIIQAFLGKDETEDLAVAGRASHLCLLELPPFPALRTRPCR